ncbi:unnamed protein product [Allacma fusca]|uniref:Alanyl-tRNA synthetase n=1 Tax=Allacma fusca TaxID=39272 RepID=A0A8J2JU56_9HEXA|nr:unnamed protein product [Allacma fusca]
MSMTTRSKKRACTEGIESPSKRICIPKGRKRRVNGTAESPLFEAAKLRKDDEGLEKQEVKPETPLPYLSITGEDALANFVVLSNIFNNLSTTDLDSCCGVNKMWKAVASPMIHHFKIELLTSRIHENEDKWLNELMEVEETTGYDKPNEKKYKLKLKDIQKKLEEAARKKRISIALYLRGVRPEHPAMNEFFSQFGCRVLSFGIYEIANMEVRGFLTLICDNFPNLEHLNCTSLELWDADEDDDDIHPEEIYPNLPSNQLKHLRTINFSEYIELSVSDIASILSVAPNVQNICDLPLHVVKSIALAGKGSALRSVIFPQENYCPWKLRFDDETLMDDLARLTAVKPNLHYFNIAKRFNGSKTNIRAFNKYFYKIMESSKKSLKRLTIQPTEAFAYHEIPRLEALEILELSEESAFPWKESDTKTGTGKGYRYFPEKSDLRRIFPNLKGIIINFELNKKSMDKYFPPDLFGPNKFGPSVKYLNVCKTQPLCMRELSYLFPAVKHLEVDTDVINFKFLLPEISRGWPDMEELTLNLAGSDIIDSKNKENRFLDSTITGIPEKICQQLRNPKNRRKFTEEQIEKSRKGPSIMTFENLRNLNLIMVNPYLVSRCCGGKPHVHTYVTSVAAKYGFQFLPQVKVLIGIIKNHRYLDELLTALRPVLPDVVLDPNYTIPQLTSTPSRAGKPVTANLFALDMVSVFIQGIENAWIFKIRQESELRTLFVIYIAGVYTRNKSVNKVRSWPGHREKNDPTLAFTNAGMNQFKDIILGNGRPKYPRVVNSQKCLRINDLHLVGTDTYHQTFFEMLGNWSFSNYFKTEACVMAWDLLTNVYKIDPSRLYVTYFSGGNSVPADLETKQAWENIGVPASRILPFANENFWTMGPIGPCGPSTEIHFDHRGVASDPTEVNKDSGVVVEIWNLVFMQYNRLETGKLERLPLSHVVDTGAGLERLTAVLNNEVSNYETDLFSPIFQEIHKMTGIEKYSSSFESDLDMCYRIFADHMRATTVALSDGVLPQTNQKIRRLIQRSLSITQTRFIPSVKSSVEIVDFLQEIVETISLTLSGAYPEVDKMQKETVSILAYEVMRYLDFLKSHEKFKGQSHIIPPLLAADFPSLLKVPKGEIEGVRNLKKIDGKTACSWYESHGVTQEAMEELAVSFGVVFDPEEFSSELNAVKKVFRDEVTKQTVFNEERLFIRKIESLLALYDPKISGGVRISSVDISSENPVFIEWVFDDDGDPVEEICDGNHAYWIVLNQSPFTPGDEHYQSDDGYILLENNCRLHVCKVRQLPSGWIIHQVKNVPEIGFSRHAHVQSVDINNETRYGREMSQNSLMYLKKWLKRKYGIVRFGREYIFDKEIKLEVTILHGEIKMKEIEECQHMLNEYAAPIVVTKRTLKKNGEFELICATGLAAEVAMRCGWEISKAVSELTILMKKCETEFTAFRKHVEDLADEIRECIKTEHIQLPYEVYLSAEESLHAAEKLITKQDTIKEIAFMAEEIHKVTEPFVIKAFLTDSQFTSLKKVTRAAENKPVLVLVHSSDGFIQGRCCVPHALASDEFSAAKWMDCFVTELGRGSISTPKGQDPKLLMLLKRSRVQDSEGKIKTALEKATEYARRSTMLSPPLTQHPAENNSRLLP